MKTKTVYVCEHCLNTFDNPCEEHEIECLAEKERMAQLEKAAARVEPLCNIMLGEKTDDPIGAKINGVTFLITTPFNKKAIKSFSGATELISASTKPSKRDAALIKRANEILAA
jgi:hypothetical protein